MTRFRPTAAHKKVPSFRVGRVRVYLRGRVWYLCYHECGQRRQPRVGLDRDEARRMAAEIHAQLESAAPTSLGFEPISLIDLRKRWLDHHEYVRRSSLATVRRYRAATAHLLHFIGEAQPIRRASDFRPAHAENFVRFLRSLKVAPNGHANADKRRLRDKGIKFILEICCTLFNYAARQRHLPPYAENPFRSLEIGRIPIHDPKPVVILTEEEERKFLEACDQWQFPLFATLLMTGLRPGELTHLLLTDVELESGWLHVRNKPDLGWKVKTRNERSIPLLPALVAVLRTSIDGRREGPLFQQRRCAADYAPPLVRLTSAGLRAEAARRIEHEASSDREATAKAFRSIWRDLGVLKEDWIRKEFMQLMRSIGRPDVTAPKTLRHTFATCLQDANVDPLIRNELMGHVPDRGGAGGGGLAMTAIYTHTRPETKRRQLAAALSLRPSSVLAEQWVRDWPCAPSTPTRHSGRRTS
jgi:integrase